MMLDEGKHCIVNHVLVVGGDAFAHQGLATVILYLLGASNLGEDDVGITRHAHVAPRLAIVGILGQHEGLGVRHVLVVQLDGVLAAHVYHVAVTQLQLDEADDAIVDDGYELGPQVLAHLRGAVDFKGADALGLDEYLVGERTRTQDAPRRAVVFYLGYKQLATHGDDLVELFARVV